MKSHQQDRQCTWNWACNPFWNCKPFKWNPMLNANDDHDYDYDYDYDYSDSDTLKPNYGCNQLHHNASTIIVFTLHMLRVNGHIFSHHLCDVRRYGHSTRTVFMCSYLWTVHHISCTSYNIRNRVNNFCFSCVVWIENSKCRFSINSTRPIMSHFVRFHC